MPMKFQYRLHFFCRGTELQFTKALQSAALYCAYRGYHAVRYLYICHDMRKLHINGIH